MNKKIKVLIASALVITATVTTLRFTEAKEVQAGGNTKAKNVIMMIADGMSTEALTLARYVKGSDLAMDSISTGVVNTSWALGPITDSAPGATAYASGQKTNNKYIGTATDNTPLATLVEGAESKGKATGIIATSEITHATPADFVAHINNRALYNTILRQLINNEMEVVLGGGFNKASGFKDVENFGTYYGERVNEIIAEGFTFVQNKADMMKFDGTKLWGSFADADLKYDYDRIADNDEIQPSLSEMTKKAVQVLNKNQDGFFLMVEGSKVDWAAHANNSAGIVSDILAFDEAVQSALEFAKADGNTVVVVTTDHGNSGITIGSNYYNSNVGSYDKATFDQTVYKLRNAKITEERFNSLAKDKSDAEIIKLASENYGIEGLTAEELVVIKETGIREVIARRCGIGYTTTGHTGEDIYLGIYAPAGVEVLSGVVDNTEVNRYMQRVLFGGDILTEYTSKIYQDGQSSIEKINGTTIALDTTIKHAPKIIIERLGNKIELELYTNNYTINGEEKELKTVIPYINEKFFVPQELLDIVNGLEVRKIEELSEEIKTEEVVNTDADLKEVEKNEENRQEAITEGTTETDKDKLELNGTEDVKVENKEVGGNN